MKEVLPKKDTHINTQRDKRNIGAMPNSQNQDKDAKRYWMSYLPNNAL